MLRSLLVITIVCSWATLSAQTFLKKFNTVSGITPVGSKIFFIADDGIHGNELWITDGTAEGTRLVKDINPGFSSADPSYLSSFNNELFFVANTLQFGNELWKSDGTEAGTTLVKDVYPGDGNGSDPRYITLYNNNLYFDASPDGFNRAVYKSNGTAAGTVVLKAAAFGEVSDMEVAGNYLYYVFANGQLWRTDGTPGASVNIAVDAYNVIDKLTTVDDQLFFTTSSPQNVNVRLYKLSGTSAPSLLKEYNAPASSTNELTNFTAVENNLFYSIRNDNQDTDVDELWVSDGTVGGTTLVKSFLWDGSVFSSTMKNFFAFNNQLYFQNGSAENESWWKSDGSSAGTVQVSSMRIGYPSWGDYPPVISDGKIYLSGEGELWISDGTTGGTMELYNINQSYLSAPGELTDVNGLLYFVANDGYSNALWNATPASEIDVLDPAQSSVLSGGSLGFEEVLTGDCSVKTIEVTNVGAKELVLTTVTVTGKDFFISGEVPALLKPNEKFPVNVYFLPFTQGDRTGTITITSNDANESSYVIQLNGVGNLSSTAFCDAFESGLLKKSLLVGTQSTIVLSNNSILEKQASGTIIGTISTTSSGYTFTLVSGEGDADNDKFVIDGSSLKSQSTFQYGDKNIYTVRIKGQKGAEEIEEQVTIIVLQVLTNSLPVSDCGPVNQRINSALLDVEFNSLGHLFASGNGGKLLRSTDGGTTWTSLNSGVSTQLTRLIFKGTTGYAAGDGVLIKSDDNGATWFQLYVPAGSQLAAKTLFFLNADLGYAGSFAGEILKTTDGGLTWKSQGNQFSSDATSLYFWSENNGIACTSFGTVLKTSDGGKSWNAVDISSIGNSNLFTNLSFINEEKGFLLSLDKLFTTNDGGDHWVEESTVSGTYFQEVRFVTNDIGYVIGGYQSNELFMSVNGGDSWNMVSANPMTAARGIAFNNTNNKVVLCGANTSDLGSTEAGSAIISANAGTTAWTIHDDLHTEDFYTVTFPTATVGYVAGNEDMYKTVNGGLTWKRLGLQKQIFGTSFVTDQNGYYVDGFRIYSTTNGGTNWTKKFELPESGPANLKAVIALSSSVILSYSEEGKIYRTNDGGTTWPVVFNQPVNSLQQIYFATTSVGYGVDLLGKLIKTTNGGASWSIVYTPPGTGESFNTLYFFDASNGLMAGANGVMYKTINGGVNWTKMFSGISAGIKRIIFEDAQVGYAFTDQGTIYKSFDGGDSWEYFGAMSYIGLNTVAKTGAKIYYAGDYGNLGKIDLPNAPTRPGYISGDQIVCNGDAVEFNLASNPDQHYYWSIAGAKLTTNNNTASVQFTTAGEYTLNAQLYSTCGTSEIRSLTITVQDPPQPVILGSELVPANSSVQFDVQNPQATSHYAWDVVGALSFDADAGSVSVNWGEDDGSVSVMETSGAGCRATATRTITIDPTTIVGVNDGNVIDAGVLVYPNPTHDQILIESSLSSELRVKIYNLMGQEYSIQSLQPFSSNSINMASLPNGLYLLEISGAQGKSKAVKRIIKN